MSPYRLLPLVVLAGCATAPPVTRIVTITPQIPPGLLRCAPAPVVPEATTQSQVADYIVSLWLAGQDCRAHVNAMRTVLAK
jgi:hypothetical protein